MTATDIEPIPVQEGNRPAFDEPWQAQAFSLLVALHRKQKFPWKNWAETFGAVIVREPSLAGESTNDTYYRQWVTALVEFLSRHDIVEEMEITAREEEWRKAYLNTPHGNSILLENAICRPSCNHHAPTFKPVAVSVATA